MPDRILNALADAGNSPWLIGLLAFLGASFAGLAEHLRSGKAVTRRAVAAAMLNSGIIGTIIALIGYKQYVDDLPYLIGMSMLAGIGGATMIDFAIQALRRKLGITIRIEQDQT